MSRAPDQRELTHGILADVKGDCEAEMRVEIEGTPGGWLTAAEDLQTWHQYQDMLTDHELQMCYDKVYD